MRSKDRKSTRLNSSHTLISYAVFCLKKKKKQKAPQTTVTQDQPDVQQIVPRSARSDARLTSHLSIFRTLSSFLLLFFFFFFLMIRRPPRSTLFPTRRSSD